MATLHRRQRQQLRTNPLPEEAGLGKFFGKIGEGIWQGVKGVGDWTLGLIGAPDILIIPLLIKKEIKEKSAGLWLHFLMQTKHMILLMKLYITSSHFFLPLSSLPFPFPLSSLVFLDLILPFKSFSSL